MMVSIERGVKDQYAKVFKKSDWVLFKESADYYFESATYLLKNDIKYGSESHRLLRRNIQKRLFIGIACELLIKAVYLKNGYVINKFKNSKDTEKMTFPFKYSEICIDDLKDDDTFSFNQVIDGLVKIHSFNEDKKSVLDGLKVSKVFRNKEGHTVTYRHNFQSENYSMIEKSVTIIYRQVFNEHLSFKIAFAKNDIAEFICIKRLKDELE